MQKSKSAFGGKSTNEKRKGFTLIEVTVVIFIISLAMVGVLSLVTQNIRAEYINRNTLIASQLAQEGLELVRNIRDENWLTTGASWKDDIIGDGTYAIDYTGRTSVNAAINSLTDAGAVLNIDANGFYWHGAGAASGFSRLIAAVDYGDYLAASSTVRWSEKGNYYNYAAETILYDWK